MTASSPLPPDPEAIAALLAELKTDLFFEVITKGGVRCRECGGSDWVLPAEGFVYCAKCSRLAATEPSDTTAPVAPEGSEPCR